MSLTMIGNQNIIFFCACYTIYNLVWGLQYLAMDTIIMDAITPNIENYIYKIDYWFTNLAMAFGALLGGIMYHQNKALLFFIAFIIFLLVLMALWKCVPKDESSKPIKTDMTKNMFSIFNSYEVVLKDIRFIMLTIGFSMIMMGELSASSYIAVQLKEEFSTDLIFHIDGVKMYSVLMIVNTILVITATYMISKIIVNYTEKKILILGLAMYIIGYSQITYLNDFYLLIIFMIIATIGEIIYVPIYAENMFKIIPKDKRGTYSALNSLGFNFAELVARFGIVLGVFLSSKMMGLYTFIFLCIGAVFNERLYLWSL